MKTKIYFLIVSLFLAFGQYDAKGQSAPQNFDIGIFPIGTFNQVNTPNQQFEVAIKTNQVFPAIPAAAELNFYLEVPDTKLNGDEVFNIAEDALNGGDEIFQVSFPFCNGKTFLGFVYNGTGINLSLYPVNTWVFVFTVTIANIAPGVPSDYIISDQNSCLFTEASVRSALNVLDYNEFLPVSSMGSLPVRLISFSAEKSGDKNALLKWSTASESNSSYFGVERSFDKITWKQVGKVNAAGNSQIILNYQFLDSNVNEGINGDVTAYYRLKMVDIDNSFKYSPIESVNFGNGRELVANDKTEDFLVYPNPASEGIHVEWDAALVDQPTALEFYDLSGKLIFSEKVEDQTSQHYVDFTKNNIETGLCLMRVMSGDKAIQFKQIVVGKNH